MIQAANEAPLKGKVALVTGAGAGLGRAVANELRARGAIVYAADIAGEGVIRADLSSPEGNREVISRVVAEGGGLDILVLNAGCQHVAPLHQFPDEAWVRLRSVMLDGPFYALKAAWEPLTKRRGGRVVVTASVSSFSGAVGKVAYTAAKHGVMGLVRVAAREGAPHGLTVNAIAPGWMDTGLLRGQVEDAAARRGITPEAQIAQWRSWQPGDRFIELHEVGATVGFLASPAASAINGVCLPIDLGATA